MTALDLREEPLGLFSRCPTSGAASRSRRRRHVRPRRTRSPKGHCRSSALSTAASSPSSIATPERAMRIGAIFSADLQSGPPLVAIAGLAGSLCPADSVPGSWAATLDQIHRLPEGQSGLLPDDANSSGSSQACAAAPREDGQRRTGTGTGPASGGPLRAKCAPNDLRARRSVAAFSGRKIAQLAETSTSQRGRYEFRIPVAVLRNPHSDAGFGVSGPLLPQFSPLLQRRTRSS